MTSHGTTDTDSGKHPVPRSTAPWNLKAESYMLFLKLNKLPEGVYDPVEENWADEKKHGEFKGGLGGVMIIRYSDTPVGPYDEIMFLPGNFTVPQPLNGPPKIPKKALRICRIYVSQRTTTYNGRLNWNIPKHLARFSFSAPPTPKGSSPPETLDVKVFPPGTKDGDGIAPFFSATLTPFKWLPSIPVSTRWAPISTAQVQPPIPDFAGFKQAVEATLAGPEIDPYDINPEHQGALLAGTDRWCTYDINSYAPRARGCWVSVHDPAKEAAANSNSPNPSAAEGRKYFPQDLQPWRVGAWLEDAEIDISAPIEWKL